MFDRRTVLAALSASWMPAPITILNEEARLRAVIDSHVVQGFSGSVLVAQGDQPALFDGFGMNQANTAGVARDDRFWIASTAKQFIAAAVLALVDDGAIGLDDPLSRFFPVIPRDKAAITLRQLLSHTSGLAQSYASERQVDRESAAAAMFAEAPEAPPGGRFIYSNSNSQLALAVVEVVSGSDFPTFVETRFLSMAGMTRTGYAGSTGAALVNPIRGELPPRLRQTYWGGQGAFSTAGDLFRWSRALRDGRALTPNSFDTLLTPVVPISEGHAALGWFIGTSPQGNRTAFARGNEDFGANSLVYLYPALDTTIIVLTHSGDSGERSWSRTVHADLETALRL